jgi:outer membrane protein
MKALTIATMIGGLLVAGPVLAQQAPPQQTPPAQPQAAKPAPPELKFPDGAKYAYIDIQRIASESAEGKASSAKIEALRQKKTSELNEKNKALEALQAKQRSSVMSDEARIQVQKDIDKTQVEIQRMTQDAQAELQDLQNELQVEFQRKLGPIIQQLAVEKGLHMLFSQTDAGLVWADPVLDLTSEVIKRFDAAMPAPKPA